MNGKQYWKDKIPIFIINIICMVLLSVFLFFVGNNVDSIAVILIIWTMLLAGVLTFTYYQRKRRLNRLVKMAEGLEEKYLLSEMLPEPEHAEEQVYFQLFKMASKSMLEQIGTVARERQEYREYIEQWIHEIKTPITAMKLLCENHKEPFTRELMRELEKTNRYTEQALYYARSEYTEKDYSVQEIRLFDVVHQAIAKFRRENLGFIFQDFNLLDTLTISENIALALTINHIPVREIEPKVEEIAKSLNIADILDKYPYQVSGGQKQRCACARAIINHPKLILADEPTGALDSHSSQMLLSTMQSMNENLGATILMVTHDAFSASYANRILFLRDGVIFTEILKGRDTRKVFFDKILNVLTMMGGGVSDVY